jgi:hypothetical protein
VVAAHLSCVAEKSLLCAVEKEMKRAVDTKRIDEKGSDP